jgi:lysozyme family protein
MTYIVRVALAATRLLNAVLGGSANESLSSRAWRYRGHSRYGPVHQGINTLFFWQDNHCRHAYLAEKNRRDVPSELPGDEPL